MVFVICDSSVIWLILYNHNVLFDIAFLFWRPINFNKNIFTAYDIKMISYYNIQVQLLHGYHNSSLRLSQ